ncbi:hypothetical protein JYA35_19230 [Bacillus velezensis]|uniref:KAP family P-loop NTPase fold protein n=1 Tax=Bacillus velezensis TaxID=492670 RepID=UPI0019D3CEA1|nr:P-loop NTPase fold protein [Bacillus velezensis]MBN7744715.1 hypothetical protein [Bacillus velezensis]
MEYQNYLPLTDIDQDKLNFSELSKEIADFINVFPSDIPFSLSINGTWGSGKSTMLNFIERNLNQEKCNIIRFNPWLITNREDLILAVFEEINNQIENTYAKAKEKLKSYSLKFIPTFLKGITYYESMKHGLEASTSEFIANGVSEVSSGLIGGFDKPLSVQKKELETELKKVLSEQNKKIVVFIDELDRLFPDEIITVFQMIKAILDLPGILFVVAMDGEVVKNALIDKGIQNPVNYLEKIFQKNYNLFTRLQIRTLTEHYLFSRLDLQKECDRSLKTCLDVYIMANTDLWIKEIHHDENLFLENCKVDETHYDWKLDKINRSSSINESYWDIFRELSDSLGLNNPRRFGKFAEFLLENWPKLYTKVLKGKVGNHYHHSAFVLLVTNFFFPEYCLSRYLISKYYLSGDEEDSLPKYIKVIRNHFNLIFPSYYREVENGNRKVLKTTNFIETCCHSIISYPDIKRR